MDQQTAYQQSIEPQDKFAPNKTLYDAGYGEIILRNFLAGMSRALGGIVLYFAFVLIMMNLFLTYTWPHIQSLVNEYMQAMKSLNSLNKNIKPGTGPELQQYQKLLQELQQKLP